MPLDPEDHDDLGAIVKVPPGECTVTPYRVDWQALRREASRYAGPDEVIVLTPVAGAKPVRDNAVVLANEGPADLRTWVGAFSIDGLRFECRTRVSYFGEPLVLNLTPAAAKSLKLKPGRVLRLTASNLKDDAVFRDDLPYDQYSLWPGRFRRGDGQTLGGGIDLLERKPEREAVVRPSLQVGERRPLFGSFPAKSKYATSR